jgi:hypothetical protein
MKMWRPKPFLFNWFVFSMSWAWSFMRMEIRAGEVRLTVTKAGCFDSRNIL